MTHACSKVQIMMSRKTKKILAGLCLAGLIISAAEQTGFALDNPSETTESEATVVEKIELDELTECAGLFIQERTENGSGKVYTAEVSFYEQDDTPYCHIVYDNFAGEISDAPVEKSEDDTYMFHASPTGTFVSRELPFDIWFGMDDLRIKWGESCDYLLHRSYGAMDELEEVPLTETDNYQEIIGILEKYFNGTDMHYHYDDETATLNVYTGIGMNPAVLLANKSNMHESWQNIMDGVKDLSGRLALILTLTLRDGIYDFTEGHCRIQLVEGLGKIDSYEQEHILGEVKDGEIVYDVLGDWSFSSGSEGLSDPGSISEGSSSAPDNAAYSATAGERNALRRAGEYLDVMPFSYTGLIKQLEYEGYTHSEAVYAADRCGADWKEQAALKAADYLELMSFSYDGLIEQLEFEGYTHEQAVYGANRAYH